MNIQTWTIGTGQPVPDWVQELINRKILKHVGPTTITDIWTFKHTIMSSATEYLYDGDMLIYVEDMIGIVYDSYKNFDKFKEKNPVKKIYCDICKKEIPPYQDSYFLSINCNDENNSCKDFEFEDVCEECYDNFMQWRKNRATK